MPTLSIRREGNTGGRAIASAYWTCEVKDPWHAWNLHAREPGDPTSARHEAVNGPVEEGDGGTYRALPSKRAYIPKPDGRQRPLGIAALEDKIVQHAVGTVLNQIYEEDFLGFSYGFRPRRSAHDALDALSVAILRRKVNWVLDADIRDCLDPFP